MEILDIHTHHSFPQPEGVIAIRVRKETTDLTLEPNQKYSVGIHPWDSVDEPEEREYELLERMAEEPEVVTIGETGIDLNIGGPLFRQLQIFRKHVELSEKSGKPLVIHDVKAHDIIIGARRDLKPKQNWAIHGFRQKPQIATMLLKAGCYLSFGSEFNAETLLNTPEERILAETDESELTIKEVIAKISAVKDKDMTATIAENTRRFLKKQE